MFGMLLISQLSSIASPENTPLMKTMDAMRILHTTIFEKVSLETGSWCIAMPVTIHDAFFLEYHCLFVTKHFQFIFSKTEGNGRMCLYTLFFPSSTVASRFSFHSRRELHTKGLSKTSPGMKLLSQRQFTTLCCRTFQLPHCNIFPYSVWSNSGLTLLVLFNLFPTIGWATAHSIIIPIFGATGLHNS